MAVQIIQDGQGNNAGVFIPYSEWNELKKHHKELEHLEYDETANLEILKNINKGLQELQQFKKGKLITTSAKDFLNEI